MPRVTAQTFRVFLQLFLNERVPVEMLKKRPEKGFDRPVDDFEKGDEAEAKTESKEAAQGRDELDWTHSDPPFHFYREKKCGERTSKIKSQ